MTDATMVTITVVAAAMARPVTKVIPITSMPSSDTTTVTPANRTARPAVLSDAAIESSPTALGRGAPCIGSR